MKDEIEFVFDCVKLPCELKWFHSKETVSTILKITYNTEPKYTCYELHVAGYGYKYVRNDRNDNSDFSLYGEDIIEKDLFKIIDKIVKRKLKLERILK